MNKIKILFLAVLAVSGMAIFSTPASAADWRDYRRAEINREYRETWRRREAFERNHRFGWWGRDDRFRDRGWGDRYDWRDHNRWHYHR